MKKLTTCIMLYFIASFCFGNDTFATQKKKVGNLIISYDEFDDKNIIEYRNTNVVNFSNLSLYPIFQFDDNLISYQLYISIHDKKYFNRIVFISDTSKIQIEFDSDKQKFKQLIPGNAYSWISSGIYKITREEYLKINEFIHENNIKLAVYTTDGTASQMKEYSKRAKDSFDDFYNYYNENALYDKYDITNDIPSEINLKIK